MSLFRYLLSPKMLVPAIAVAITGVLGFAVANQSAAHAYPQDCDNNAIIKCGYPDPSTLATKVAGSSELQAIYNHQFTAGWSMGNVNNWKANAKHVTVYKDGRAVLDDGTVIATGVNSLGRTTLGSSQRQAVKIGNTTYYYSSTQVSFAANSISGYALINPDDHSLQFGALTSCGNPFWGNTPGYKCQMLNQKKVNDTTYQYSVTPYTKGGATVSKVVIDFGDGKSQTLTSNFTQTVSHTYAPGKFTARATVYFKANGQDKSDTRAECTKPVDVPQPPKPVFVCDSLVKIQNSRTKYSFTVKGKSDRATFISAKFDFGDGQTAADLKGNNETVTTSHEYAKDGDYTVKAYLTYKEGTTAETAACVVKVTVNKQTCADKPNAPECQPPKQTCADTPNAPECQPPKTCENTPGMAGCQALPSTGPVEIVGSALGLGSIAGAGMYYRNTRRSLIDTILKR